MTNCHKDVLLYCCVLGILAGSGQCLAETKKGSEDLFPPDCRAGHPHSVAWYARPSIDQHYCGGYVGGGAVQGGHERCPDEGTWGLDYTGALFKKHVWLRWWHGRHDQDGGGSYVTDGPRLLSH